MVAFLTNMFPNRTYNCRRNELFAFSFPGWLALHGCGLAWSGGRLASRLSVLG